MTNNNITIYIFISKTFCIELFLAIFSIKALNLMQK